MKVKHLYALIAISLYVWTMHWTITTWINIDNNKDVSSGWLVIATLFSVAGSLFVVGCVVPPLIRFLVSIADRRIF